MFAVKIMDDSNFYFYPLWFLSIKLLTFTGTKENKIHKITLKVNKLLL